MRWSSHRLQRGLAGARPAPVAFRERCSWGYYNSLTKQEPPADRLITPGDDTFFALRMAKGLGMKPELPPEDEQYVLQGLDARWTVYGQYWPRRACLRPEAVQFVEFYANGDLLKTAYDEPFMMHQTTTWLQNAWQPGPDTQ